MKSGRYLIAFLVLMTFLIVFGNRGLIDNYLVGKRLAQLNEENHSLAAQNRELEKRIVLLRSDPAYIESIARSELGMVKESDIVYRLSK